MDRLTIAIRYLMRMGLQLHFCGLELDEFFLFMLVHGIFFLCASDRRRLIITTTHLTT
jgi:hypothetical protein